MKHNCEMFDLEINDNSFMNDGHLNDIIPDNECSIYTLLKKLPFQKVSVGLYIFTKEVGKRKRVYMKSHRIRTPRKKKF